MERLQCPSMLWVMLVCLVHQQSLRRLSTLFSPVLVAQWSVQANSWSRSRDRQALMTPLPSLSGGPRPTTAQRALAWPTAIPAVCVAASATPRPSMAIPSIPPIRPLLCTGSTCSEKTMSIAAWGPSTPSRAPMSAPPATHYGRVKLSPSCTNTAALPHPRHPRRLRCLNQNQPSTRLS